MKAKTPEKSRWGGARKGAGRHPRSVKSRFTHVTRIDPAHTRSIDREEGFSFAQKLDAVIKKGLCKK
jgi:hypothetical protein